MHLKCVWSCVLARRWRTSLRHHSKVSTLNFQLRVRPERPFVGPELACSIGMRVARKRPGTGHRPLETVGLLKCQGTHTGDKGTVKLEQKQLRRVVGLFSGHCLLNGPSFKTGTEKHSQVWKLSRKRRISPTYPCDCEALAHLRFHHMGRYFMEPKDYHDPHKENPTLHQKCRVDRGMNKKGKHNRF
jgi:hypothetical protein